MNLNTATNDTTGTNINANGGATIVVNKANGNLPATITFNKNAGISIDAQSSMNWIDGDFRTTGTGVITNKGNLIKSPGTTGGGEGDTDLAIVNSGTFQLLGGNTVKISGKDANNYAFDQSAGICELSNQSILNPGGGNGFHMAGGSLFIDGATGATIGGGNVLIDGGLIALNHDHPNAIGALIVANGLTIQGTAEFDAKINCTAPLSSDLISANSITLGGNATLKAVSINIPTGGVPLGKSWTILKATGTGKTIGGDFATFILDFNDGSGKKYTHSKNAGNTEYYVNS